MYLYYGPSPLRHAAVHEERAPAVRWHVIKTVCSRAVRVDLLTICHSTRRQTVSGKNNNCVKSRGKEAEYNIIPTSRNALYSCISGFLLIEKQLQLLHARLYICQPRVRPFIVRLVDVLRPVIIDERIRAACLRYKRYKTHKQIKTPHRFRVCVVFTCLLYLFILHRMVHPYIAAVNGNYYIINNTFSFFTNVELFSIQCTPTKETFHLLLVCVNIKIKF